MDNKPYNTGASCQEAIICLKHNKGDVNNNVLIHYHY